MILRRDRYLLTGGQNIHTAFDDDAVFDSNYVCMYEEYIKHDERTPATANCIKLMRLVHFTARDAGSSL